MYIAAPSVRGFVYLLPGRSVNFFWIHACLTGWFVAGFMGWIRLTGLLICCWLAIG